MDERSTRFELLSVATVLAHQCQGSDPDIFAIGECARWNGSVYGLVLRQ